MLIKHHFLTLVILVTFLQTIQGTFFETIQNRCRAFYNDLQPKDYVSMSVMGTTALIGICLWQRNNSLHKILKKNEEILEKDRHEFTVYELKDKFRERKASLL